MLVRNLRPSFQTETCPNLSMGLRMGSRLEPETLAMTELSLRLHFDFAIEIDSQLDFAPEPSCSVYQ